MGDRPEIDAPHPLQGGPPQGDGGLRPGAGRLRTGALPRGLAGDGHHPDTYPIDGEFPLQKRRYSCFVGTDLDILLRA